MFESDGDGSGGLGAPCLKPGSVIDTSRMRGQLIGVTKNWFAYIGQKLKLYKAIKALSCDDVPCPLVHVRGVKHVGKRRFLKEVCYYFYNHHQFRFIIMFKDLSKLESQQEFRDFMDLLNQQIEQRHGNDLVTENSTG